MDLFPKSIKNHCKVAVVYLWIEFIIHIKEHPARRNVKQIVTIHGQQPEIKQGHDLAITVEQEIAGKEVAVNEAVVAAIGLVEKGTEALYFCRELRYILAQIRGYLRQSMGEIASEELMPIASPVIADAVWVEQFVPIQCGRCQKV